MSDFKKYHCLECEHIYDEEKGDPDSGIAPGTRWPIYLKTGLVDMWSSEKFF